MIGDGETKAINLKDLLDDTTAATKATVNENGVLIL
jgi:hypothetical protein